MTNKKNNVDQLHDSGALNKEELSDDHKRALNSLSQEEVEQLKSIHKSVNKDNDDDSAVGVFL